MSLLFSRFLQILGDRFLFVNVRGGVLGKYPVRKIRTLSKVCSSETSVSNNILKVVRYQVTVDIGSGWPPVSFKIAIVVMRDDAPGRCRALTWPRVCFTLDIKSHFACGWAQLSVGHVTVSQWCGRCRACPGCSLWRSLTPLMGWVLSDPREQYSCDGCGLVALVALCMPCQHALVSVGW